MTNKILFLDVDGVLNYLEMYTKRISEPENYKKELSSLEYNLSDLDATLCNNLSEIITITGCDVCLVSSWKCCAGWREAFSVRGIPNVNDFHVSETSWVGSRDYRGIEVVKFLESHKQYTTYCIIDDENGYFDFQLKNKVTPSFYKFGLTEKLKTKAIKILNKVSKNEKRKA